MVKTLLEIFSEPDDKQKKKRNPNRSARSRGSQAEALLIRHLNNAGYEARRTHLSAFPDILAWNESEVLMIEVKARSQASNNAVSLFKSSVKLLKVVNNHAHLLCYLRFKRKWLAYKWTGSGVEPTQSVVNEER